MLFSLSSLMEKVDKSRNISKTDFKEASFENVSFLERWVSKVDRWNRYFQYVWE